MQKLMTAQLKQQQNELSFRQEMRHEEKSSETAKVGDDILWW
jgi:hypothetical protein